MKCARIDPSDRRIASLWADAHWTRSRPRCRLLCGERLRRCHTSIRVGRADRKHLSCKAGRHVDRRRSHVPLVGRSPSGWFYGDVRHLFDRLLICGPSSRHAKAWRGNGRTGELRLGPLGHESRQRLTRFLGNDGLARDRLEACDEHDVSLRSAHLVARDPEVVGVAQLRLAVVFRQFIRQEHELFLGRVVHRRVLRGRERVDGHGPVDGDRLVIPLGEEHESSAESSHAHLSRLAQDRIGPNVGDSIRHLRLGLPAKPAKTLGQVHLGATDRKAQHHGGDD